MTNIPRYQIEPLDSPIYDVVETLNANGPWCRWSDVESLEAELNAWKRRALAAEKMPIPQFDMKL